MSQGLEEANLQGQFLGQRYRLTSFVPGEIDRAPASQAAVLLAALGDSELVKLGQLAPGRAVFDLGSESDTLRARCLPNLLHILPSTRMKADALAQWQHLHPGSRARVQAWHPNFTKYAAEQLNQRYRKAQGRDMDDRAWAGWAAVKMVADPVARLGTAEATPLLDYLKTDLAFDGQKGVTMSFRKKRAVAPDALDRGGPAHRGRGPGQGGRGTDPPGQPGARRLCDIDRRGTA
ncbi:MAG: ABC transporter substrate-binding protein [Gammaproteobacteria bacterium]